MYCSGSGQMNTTSPCYTCDKKVYPMKILPYRRRRYRKTTNTHCCDAPDCTGHDPVQIHEVDPGRVYDDGTDNSSSTPIDTTGSSSKPIDTAGVTEQVGQLHIGKQKSQNASPSSSGQRNTESRRTRSKGIQIMFAC